MKEKKKQNEEYEIILNDNTKITYEKISTDKSNTKKFIIENKNINNEINQIIIKFCEAQFDYTIFVCIKEINKNKLNENKLYIVNDKEDNSYPAYKYLNLKFCDGSEKEMEGYIDLNEKEILDEIFFILYHGEYFKEKDVLRSFEIITPILNDLIKEFIEFKSESMIWNNKKLVKKN